MGDSITKFESLEGLGGDFLAVGFSSTDILGTLLDIPELSETCSDAEKSATTG